GPGLDAGEVAAGVGLGHGDAQNELARDALRQDARLLLRGPELAEVGADQARMQRYVEARLAVARVLLDQDLLVAEIGDARAAVLLVGPHEEKPERPGFAERLPVRAALCAPALRIGTDLGLEEAPRRVAELLVLGFENVPPHASCPLIKAALYREGREGGDS